jgi:hypothetical protein
MGKRIANAIIGGLAIAIVSLWTLIWMTSGKPPKVPTAEERRAVVETNRAQARRLQEQRDLKDQQSRLRIDAAKRSRQRLAQQANAARMEPRRWAPMGSVDGVWLDGSGRAWTLANLYSGQEDGLRTSVEEAARNQTRLIHGGRVLLTDSRGRIWCGPGHADTVSALFIYDAGHWREPPLLPGPNGVVLSATEQGELAYHARAWEDSTGNIYVAARQGEGSGWLLYRCDRQDAWQLVMVLPASGPCVFDAHPTLTEQPSGRLVIWPTMVQWPRAGLMPYFDGQRWSLLDPSVCPEHPPKHVAPLGDGSIASICTKDRLWFYWPEGVDPVFEGRPLAEWIAFLSGHDRSRRDHAERRLPGVGPQMLPRLRSALESKTDEEGRLRLANVITRIETSSTKHRSGIWLDDGRIEGGDIRGWWVHDGCLSVVVRGLTDRFADPRIERRRRPDARDDPSAADAEADRFMPEVRLKEALIRFRQDGRWQLGGVPWAQWDEVGLVPSLTRPWQVDRNGDVWCGDGFRLRTDLTAERVVPQGMEYWTMLQDVDGTIYVSMGGWYVCKPHIAEAAIDGLPEQPQSLAMILRSSSRARIGWATHSRNPEGDRVLRLGTDAVPVPSVGDQMWMNGWVPLDRGVLAWFVTHGEGDRGRDGPYLWDGEQWHKGTPRTHTGDVCLSFAHELPQTIARIAGPSLQGRVFAAPGDGTLWFDGTRTAQPELQGEPYVPHLEFFDGQAWHDVWAELGHDGSLPYGDCIELADRGRTLLMWCPTRNALHAIQLKGGRFVETKLDRISFNPADGDRGAWPAADGSVWLCGASGLIRYADGKIERFYTNAAVVLVDSASRVWCRTEGGIDVLVAGQWCFGEIVATHLKEGPDGRVWSLDEFGVTELAVSHRGKSPVVVEAARHLWSSMRNRLDDAFIDDANGLWVRSSGAGLTRVQLPPATQPASAVQVHTGSAQYSELPRAGRGNLGG